MRQDKAALGFVVIGRNEGNRLREGLSSLIKTEFPVLYADSGSTDGSVDFARDLGAQVIILDDTTPMNAGRGRREGFEGLLDAHPELEYVQFVDGDCLIHEEWIDIAVQFLEDHSKAAVVCGRRFERSPDFSPYNRLCDSEWNTPVGKTTACGGDSLMRVVAYRQVGGFRPDLMAGEEPELCARLRRIGWEIWRIDAAMTEHDANMRSFGQWMRRSVRGGFGYAQVRKKTAGLPERLFGRQIASALLWSVVLPLSVIAISLLARQFWPITLYPAAFVAQSLRLAARPLSNESFGPLKHRLQKAILMMTAKWAEGLGLIQYTMRGGEAPTRSYKDG